MTHRTRPQSLMPFRRAIVLALADGPLTLVELEHRIGHLIPVGHAARTADRLLEYVRAYSQERRGRTPAPHMRGPVNGRYDPDRVRTGRRRRISNAVCEMAVTQRVPGSKPARYTLTDAGIELLHNITNQKAETDG